MENIEVYDDVFDLKYLVELYDDLKKIPIKTGNIANRKTWPYGEIGTHNLLGSILYARTSYYNIESIGPHKVFDILEHFVPHVLKKPFDLVSCSLNVQGIGMDGSFHTDVGKQIILFASIPWKEDWGGELEIETSIKLEKIEYKPGRLVVFDGNIKHRGLAPNIPNIFRYSINYRG